MKEAYSSSVVYSFIKSFGVNGVYTVLSSKCNDSSSHIVVISAVISLISY